MNVDNVQVVRASTKIQPVDCFASKDRFNANPSASLALAGRQGPRDLDESTKDRDDYAARLYLVKSGGILIWRTKAVNYVWSSGKEP